MELPVLPSNLCLYDVYTALLQETVEILQDHDRNRAKERAKAIETMREALAIEPTYLDKAQEIPPGLAYLRQQTKQCNPHILSPEVVRLAMEMCEKANEEPLPFEIYKLPLWLEFDGNTIGDDNYRFAAIFIFQDFFQADTLHCDLLELDMQYVKTIFINKQNGDWEIEQGGPCGIESPECPYAQYTVEGQPYRLRREDYVDGCTCTRAGYTWSQITRAINLLLRHRGKPFVYETLEREQPLPKSQGGKLTRKQKEERTAAQKRSRPNIVTVSLSEPVSVSTRAPGTRKEKNLELVEETISVASHWRVLVPGTNKPWKSLKIIQIESYERHQKASESRTRYKIIE